jgi:hypothetical protein
MRINKELFKINYYFLNRFKRIGGIRFIARVKIFAYNIFNIYIDLIYSSIFDFKIIGVYLELRSYSQIL